MPDRSLASLPLRTVDEFDDEWFREAEEGGEETLNRVSVAQEASRSGADIGGGGACCRDVVA